MKLDELALYLREAIPQPKMIAHLKNNEQAGVVTFSWNGREFVVKPSLEVLELKNGRVFVTGCSMLMQLTLCTRTRHEKVLAPIVEMLQQTEELINNPMNRDKGLNLIGTVKTTLKRLVGK
jgi:hypothetical protein